MAALGNSVPTPPEGIDAEIAWYPDYAALLADDPATSRAKGRIVFIDQKMERTRNGSGYGPAVAARSNGPIEAARRGALAVGIRSIGTDRAPIAHTGATRYDLSLPRIPAFAVSVPDAEMIAGFQAAGAPLRLKLKLDARSDVDATSHNVIAEVPGTDLKDEIVMIGAHLDSWDLGQGAQDDGAGVAIVSAAAGVLAAAGVAPRRTIRVVLFANEENGFDGARAYGDRYKDVVHQMVGESDFGAGPVFQLNHRVQPAAVPLFEDLARVLGPLGVAWVDGEARNRGGPGPDAALLMRRHRWPGVALGQDGTNYFDVHHTEHDTLERIDPRTLPQNVACWAVTAWLAAQAPVGFGPPVL
jgi:Zn-dependent M28 family amino/carboxypeptidase